MFFMNTLSLFIQFTQCIQTVYSPIHKNSKFYLINKYYFIDVRLQHCFSSDTSFIENVSLLNDFDELSNKIFSFIILIIN